MIARQRPELVLAIYFQSRGFAFVLLDEHRDPVDWGAPEFRGHDRAKRCLKRVDSLLALYSPDVLVLQDMSRRGISSRAPH